MNESVKDALRDALKNGKCPWNPGSKEAVSHGCKCPEIDNDHGSGVGGDGVSFWISARCPLHGKEGGAQ